MVSFGYIYLHISNCYLARVSKLESYHIGDATDTPLPLPPPVCRYQMIEGVEVIAEVESAGGPTTEDPPGVPHVDIITDLAVAVRGVHPFLFSASYNGELKIWR